MLRSFVAFFSSRPAFTVTLWILVVAFGVVAYTALLPREGFPSVDVPAAIVAGPYLVDDSEKVDQDVAVPLYEAFSDAEGVTTVQTFAAGNSFTAFVEFDSSLSTAQGTELIESTVGSLELPPEALVTVSPINAAQFLNEYDLLVGVYGGPDTTAEELEAAAATILPSFEAQAEVASADVVELISRGVNPATGQPDSRESDFNLLTGPSDDGLEFRPSIAVGVVAADGTDSLGIRDASDRALFDAVDALPDGFEAVVAIDFATQIRQQIGSLQTNVFTGLIAVALVALLLISWRASIVTALFILTVLTVTVGVLYLVGVSLNTISLFGVILALGLFVDDAIVITESIAANRREGLDDIDIIRRAIGRVGAASISGTVTTVLVFVPMLFISGILGDFIRILPISVIVALLVSLVLSFVFIPVATRFIVLPAKKDAGILSGVEERLANAVAGLAGATGRQGIIRGVLAISLSIVMTGIGLFVFAPQVGFNIFPPSKDSTEINVGIDFPPGTTIEEARALTLDVNQQAADALGPTLVQGYTYDASERGAIGQLSLTDIGSRPTAPEILEETLVPVAENFDGARVRFSQISNGPPEADFPFQAQIFSEDTEALVAAAETIAEDLQGVTIERPNGTTFTVVETEVGYTDIVARTDGRRVVEVRASFDDTDVTTLTAETQGFMEARYGPAELAALGLEEDGIGYDFGFESDNQESFGALPVAFGIALLSMLALLVFQFRSTVIWMLVFLAIPFTFFGVFGGLLLTDNVISFFVMLGLLGLIGIAVNNTILLTDFANKERLAGKDRREAVQSAIRSRFRPLITTSFTTVAGLLPLALSDPFWEALGMTIIFGLLSSTFLVLVSFPFYYLAMQSVRDNVSSPWRYQGRSDLQELWDS